MLMKGKSVKQLEQVKEDYMSGYTVEELLKLKGGVLPDLEYEEDESPEELGYEEMSLEEFEAAYKDAVETDESGDRGFEESEIEEEDGRKMSRGDSEIIERLNKLPIARDIYFRERKKRYDDGFLKRNTSVMPGDPCEVNAAKSWDERMEILKDAMDMAARRLMSDPEYKNLLIDDAKADGAGEEELRRIRRMGMIDVDKLIASLDQVSEIIRDAYTAPEDLRYDIQDTNRILVELCQRVLEDYTNYEIDDIEKIINWMNKNAKYPSYLGLYKQIYFDFVIRFVNELLKYGQDIGDVFIRALNLMIKTNSRVLSVIIREKSEDFAHVAKYVRELKRANKL